MKALGKRNPAVSVFIAGFLRVLFFTWRCIINAEVSFLLPNIQQDLCAWCEVCKTDTPMWASSVSSGCKLTRPFDPLSNTAIARYNVAEQADGGPLRQRGVASGWPR